MKDIETDLLRDRRIALYGAVSAGLHDADELWMDAYELPSGGWTARYGDMDDRLYGQAAFASLFERMGEIRKRIDFRLADYREAGGNGEDVLSDVAHALAVIQKHLLDAERLSASPDWDFEEAFGREGVPA